MSTVKAVAAFQPDSLEELAVHRLQSLPHGAGFHAYAQIVRKVQNVLRAEDRAAMARRKAIAELTPGDIPESDLY